MDKPTFIIVESTSARPFFSTKCGVCRGKINPEKFFKIRTRLKDWNGKLSDEYTYTKIWACSKGCAVAGLLNYEPNY